MSCAAHALARTRSMLCWDDVDLIRSIVRKLSDHSLVVDLGAGSGTTALAVFAENPKVKVTTIDKDLQQLSWAELAVTNADFRKNWTGITSNSLLASHLFENDSIDFLLVDASHDYASVRKDISAWFPKVKKEGYIWFHDYQGGPEEYKGIKRAVDVQLRLGTIKTVTKKGWGLAVKRL